MKKFDRFEIQENNGFLEFCLFDDVVGDRFVVRENLVVGESRSSDGAFLSVNRISFRQGFSNPAEMRRYSDQVMSAYNRMDRENSRRAYFS
jgi:hypothetical protein